MVIFVRGAEAETYEDRYKAYERPENCKALTNVKQIQLSWDVSSPKSQTMAKIQVTQKAIVKPGIVLTSLAHELNNVDVPKEVFERAVDFVLSMLNPMLFMLEQ